MNIHHLTLLPHAREPGSGEFFYKCDQGAGSVTEKNKQAYKLYSLFYPVLALCAYKMIWRGKLLKHIRFFKESLCISRTLADVATGDGTLSKKALFSASPKDYPRVTVIDISTAMLKQASKKLPRSNTIFVHGDAENLPFPEASVPLFTCFGGFNSFIHPNVVMNEFYRTLKPGGRVRGSVLLTPKSNWRVRSIDWFIEKGLQSMHIHENEFKIWAISAGFTISQLQKYGDVMLFDLEKP